MCWREGDKEGRIIEYKILINLNLQIFSLRKFEEKGFALNKLSK